MSPRQQRKAINTLSAMGVLVSISIYARSGVYAQILTQPNKIRTLPLSIAVRYANDLMNGGRHAHHA